MASNQRRREMLLLVNPRGNGAVFASPLSGPHLYAHSCGWTPRPVDSAQRVNVNENAVPIPTMRFAQAVMPNGDHVHARIYADAPQPWVPTRLGLVPERERPGEASTECLGILAAEQPELSKAWPTPAREVVAYWHEKRCWTMATDAGDVPVVVEWFYPYPPLPEGVELAG